MGHEGERLFEPNVALNLVETGMTRNGGLFF